MIGLPTPSRSRRRVATADGTFPRREPLQNPDYAALDSRIVNHRGPTFSSSQVRIVLTKLPRLGERRCCWGLAGSWHASLR